MSITAIWLFLKSKAGMAVAGILAVGAVILRMKFLVHERDKFKRNAEVAKSEATVVKATNTINKAISKQRSAAAQEEKARRELEDEQARIDKEAGGTGRTGLENDW